MTFFGHIFDLFVLFKDIYIVIIPVENTLHAVIYDLNDNTLSVYLYHLF